MEVNINDAHILLCEDDESLGMLLREYLEAKGFQTDLCVDGQEGYEAFTENKYDLCILDVMMPRMDGFTLAGKIREISPDVPFMFLTAKTMNEDVRKGFKVGADDYITKPFSMEEVVFRIEAILRRVQGHRSHGSLTYNIGRFVFDVQKQTPSIDDKSEKLTTKEAELLKILCDKANELTPREVALRAVWVDDNYFNARSMDVYITKLRKHLMADPSVEILNVHGKGYRLVVPE